jgi:hypothetical protein
MLHFILDVDAFSYQVASFRGNRGHRGNILRHLISDASNVISVNQQQRRVVTFRLNQSGDLSGGDAARAAEPQPAEAFNLRGILFSAQPEIGEGADTDENQHRAQGQSDLKWRPGLHRRFDLFQRRYVFPSKNFTPKILWKRMPLPFPAELYHFVFSGVFQTDHWAPAGGVVTLAGADLSLSLPVRSTAVTAYS